MIPIHAKRLASIDPGLAATFLEAAQAFAEKFPGCRITPAQGYRTPSMQQAANAAGRSKADGRVKLSKHQTYPASALDFAVLDPRGIYVTDGEDPRYWWVGEFFESRGYGWGGRWVTTPPDWDHVELRTPLRGDVFEAHAAYLATIAGAPFLRVT